MPTLLQRVFLRLRQVLDRMTGAEVALKGGLATVGVVRVGDTVRRPVTEKSPFVHDVLRYLEFRKFDRAPRFLGIDEKGREILTYVSGSVPRELGGFRREQWVAGAKLLRLLHDATVDCELRGDREVVCHGDPSPCNYVFRDGMPFGLIDFDLAHPGKRQEDVGYAAWMWLDIGNDELAPEEQGLKLVDFVAAYDAAATWNPLELVLLAQYELVARSHLPRGAGEWAQACIDWTERNREGIGAGIAMRSDYTKHVVPAA
jgi:hypothetical protein